MGGKTPMYILLNKVFVLEILDLPKSWESGSENSHMSHTQPPLLLTLYISVAHSAQFMNQYITIY
jgi:hypothetical protein